MTSDGTKSAGIWSPWKKLAAGMNLSASLILAFAVLVLVNILSCRFFHWRGDVSRNRFYELSERTRAALAGLKADVAVHVLIRPEESARKDTLRDLANLLKEYKYRAEKDSPLRFRVEIVDPDRDVARVSALAGKYDLKDANVVVVDCGGKTRIIPERAVAEYGYETNPAGTETRLVRSAFKGEQALTSALLSLTDARKPVAYFTTGHGECAPEEPQQGREYSGIGRAMSLDNIDVRVLDMTEKKLIPGDCDLLVIAGPGVPFLKPECAAVSAYLKANRSLLLMVESGATTGLEPLLEEWGLRMPAGKVVERTYLVSIGTNGAVALPSTGEELYVRNFNAEHAITAPMRGLTVQMNLPAPVERLAAVTGDGEGGEDKPRVSLLAFSTGEGWIETDFRQEPPRFDRDQDRPGPVAVAAAMERGPATRNALGIKPTRVVVFGDSEFVSDNLARGGNMDLFMNSVNWLLERDALVAIGPKVVGSAKIGMDGRQRTLLFVCVAVCIPLAAALAGLGMWLRRVR